VALIETFSDDFTDLSAWEAPIGSFASAAATVGELVVTYSDFGTCFNLLYTTASFTFEDSWTSIKVVDIWDTEGDNNNIFLGAMDNGVSDFRYVSAQNTNNVDPSKITFANQAADQSVDVSITPGTPFWLGMRVDASNVWTGHYSLDGSTWVQFCSDTWTGPAGDPTPRGMIYTNASGRSGASPTTFDAKFDDYNVLEPTAGGGGGGGLTVDLTAMDPAEVTVTAIPYDSITLGDPEVRFTPAIVSVLARAPLSIVLGPGAPIVDVLPAQVNVVASGPNPIVGTFEIGDPFSYPIVIRESGSGTYDLDGFTVETDEPALSGGFNQSMWIAYQADVPMQLTITASSTDDFMMELFDGEDFDTLSLLASGDTIVADINSGLTYIRLTTDEDAVVDLVWTYDSVANDLMMDVLTPLIDRTPDTVRVSVIGGTGGESIRFTWSPPVSTLIPGTTTRPITLATVTSDFEGNILTATLPLPAAPAGTYIIEARGVTSGRASNGTFKILNAPLAAESGGTPSEPVASMSVKWLWDDGVESAWIMTRNPDSMTSPLKIKVLSPERSTSGSGQHIIWNGATPAVDWSFKGVIFSLAEREHLEYYYSLNRKFWITTHRNVRYTVTMKSLEMTPKRNGSNFETWEYTANLFIYTETPVKHTATSRWNVGHL
jgi:hypothetical protein